MPLPTRIDRSQSRGNEMIRFSLPETSPDHPVAFRDAFLAVQWLARQPQTNVPLMLKALTCEIDAFNRFALPARERFKTLEALRKTVFTIASESQRHFENKLLPLTPAERATFKATSRLWRCCTLGYLYCLNACLEGEAGISDHASKVAHRAITGLRMEQLCSYWAGSSLDQHFWRELHAIYLAAEKLQALEETVRDPLPKETTESTVIGQYGMAILMHLADPYSLQHSQLSAAHQWLSRWRELVTVQAPPDTSPRAYSVVLDLSFPKEPAEDSPTQRRILFDAVFRKIGKRVKALKAGASLDDLRLGKLMTPEASLGLLEKLGMRLYSPQPVPVCGTATETQSMQVIYTLEDIYRLIGGGNFHAIQSEMSVARIKAERLAIFGHTADPKNLAPILFETWQATSPAGTTLDLKREANQTGKRLAPGNLLGIRQTPESELRLATIIRLLTQDDEFMASISFLAGTISPLIAEVTEKISNATFQYPALLIAGSGNILQAILPANVLSRALRCRLYNGLDATLLKLEPHSLIERHGDSERWNLATLD